jgi:2,3-bisphosphoglycerate-dependent phosphoglycerate mutase
MHRSLITSQFLQRELGIEPEIWVDLHEVKGCRLQKKAFPGLTRSQISAEFPGFSIPEQVTEEGWFLREQAESEEEGWERAGRVWDRLRQMGDMDKYQGKSIIIVTHGLFLDFLIGRICKRAMKGGNL